MILGSCTCLFACGVTKAFVCIRFVLDAKDLTMMVPSMSIYFLRPTSRVFSPHHPLTQTHTHTHTHTQSFKQQVNHSIQASKQSRNLQLNRTPISTINMSSRRSSNQTRSSGRDSYSDMSRGLSEMRISSRDSDSRSHSSRSGSRSHGSYSRDSGSSCCCDADPYSRDSYSGSRSRDSYSDSRAPEVGAGNVYRAVMCADGHIRAGNMDGSICMNPEVYDGPPLRGIEGFLRRNGGGNDSHSRDRTSSRGSSGRTSHGSSSASRRDSSSSSASRRDSSSSSSSRRDSGARPSSRPSAAGGELTLYGERSSASRHPSMDERSSARYSDDRSSSRNFARESSRRH